MINPASLVRRCACAIISWAGEQLKRLDWHMDPVPEINFSSTTSRSGRRYVAANVIARRVARMDSKNQDGK